MIERRGLGVRVPRPQAGVGAMQDVEPPASAAIIPYSIPLCTIFTKCPAPAGPQWR